MNTPLVSICSPCYNVAPYIGRFLDSLIAQTYKNLEVILVNDGSTDATADIIKLYIPKLQEEGYKVTYIEQENGGQSSAVNTGLKYVSGKYATFPDSDDELTPFSVESRVQVLESNEEFALVRGHMEMWDAEKDQSLGLLEPNKNEDGIITNCFESLLHSDIPAAALANMVRMDVLDKVIPNREIFVAKKAGQNWQLLLPIAFNHQCWHIPQIMGYYHIHSDSHSHKVRSYEQQIELQNVFQDTIVSTLRTIDGVSFEHTQWAIQKYSYERLCFAKFYQKRADIWRFSKELLTVTPSIGQKMKILAEAIYHILVSPIFSK